MKLIETILILFALLQIIVCNPCPNGMEDKGKKGNTQKCKVGAQYGRGGGYPWKFGDGLNLDKAKQRCEKDNPDLGCEQWGLVIYPKCKQGFKNAACCLCVPECPQTEGWGMDESNEYCIYQG